MSDYFADASYWFALIDDDDEFHTAATEYATLLELRNDRIVTTQLVLNEVLNPRGGSTAQQRRAIIALIDRIRQSPQVDIIPQSAEQFEEALALLRTVVNDKEWSITDCASFVAMRQSNISDALTSDRHFTQAGFTVILNQART